MAVLKPALSADLYFVANGKGGHVFAATMAQHEKNVAAWRAQERVKQGLPPLETEKPAAKGKAAGKAASKSATKPPRRRRHAK